MPRSNPDEFVFHLHLNEIQSAPINPTVHIHLHLAPEGGLAAPAPEVQALASIASVITIKIPANIAPNTTPVRAQDSTSGWICAEGTLTGNPDEVRAKVYRKESDIPADPPADAKTYVMDDNPFWFFNQTHNNEINDVLYAPAAESDKNWLIVWAVNKTAGQPDTTVGSTRRQIKGAVSQYTECQCQGYNASGLVGGGGLTAQVSAAPMPEILPWRYRSQFAGKFPGLPVTAPPSSQGAADQSLLLQLDARQGAAAPVWQTPLPAGGDVDAMLRLTRFGSSFRGRLTITKIAGRLLDEPLSWKTDDWRLFEPNILAPVGPTALVSSNTTAIVEPT